MNGRVVESPRSVSGLLILKSGPIGTACTLLPDKSKKVLPPRIFTSASLNAEEKMWVSSNKPTKLAVLKAPPFAETEEDMPSI